MRLSQDQLSLLGLCQIKGIDWKLLAREAQRPGGLDRLLAGELTERTPEAAETAALIAQPSAPTSSPSWTRATRGLCGSSSTCRRSCT